jgi:4-amino-4-deoxy-L-arabinose transferase-like glycosyltransferase
VLALTPSIHARPLPRGRAAWIGLLLTLALAAGLFTRLNIDDRLSRDEAVWVYGAQQMLDGVPYYKSIFDAKTPLGPMIASVGVEGARIVGGSDVHGARILFLLFACAAVAAIYELALALWGSVLAALAGAVAFLAFQGFALDAIGGPDAKTPGIAFAVFSMLLLVRRRWLWGGALGALAFLCWQPLGIYMPVAVLAALAISDRGQRRAAAARAALGALVPVAATFAYFALAHALSPFVDAAFRFPLEGLQRTPQTVGQRVGLISDVVDLHYYALHGWLFWGGLLALAVAFAVALVRPAGRSRLRDPLLWVVALTLIPLVLFTLHDFESYPDVFPLLPYSALGAAALASAVMRVRRARAGAAAVLVATAVLAGFMWQRYATTGHSAVPLSAQQVRADTIERLLGPSGRLYAIGDPTPLVLTHRRNPDSYIYLGSGVLQWKLDRSRGGLSGWLASIRAFDPGVIVLHTFEPTERGPQTFLRKLSQGYDSRWLGAWQILVKPALLRQAPEAQ